MLMKENNLIKNAFIWLQEISGSCSYAELTIRVVIHDGKIKRVERAFLEKMQPDEPRPPDSQIVP